MQIHTVTAGENLYNIARKYSIPATKILWDNDLSTDRLTPGDQLLILLPTRTVTTHATDTIEELSKRFGVRVNDILRENPSLVGRNRLKPGQILTIKQEANQIGVGSAFSIIPKGSRRENITRTLPYSTYAAIDGAIISDNGVSLTYDISKNLECITQEKKVTLLLVKDKTCARFLDNKEVYEKRIEEAISLAKKMNFMGVLISAKDAGEKRPNEFCEFLLLFRKKLIGCDMILCTEFFENTHYDASELSDAAILNVGTKEIDKMTATLEKFASNAESSKVFVNIISDCEMGSGKVSANEIKELCYRSGKQLTTDEKSLISEFDFIRYKTGLGEKIRLYFPSLLHTKKTYESLCENGFLGIAFDTDTVMIQTLLMFNSLFARADYSLP